MNSIAIPTRSGLPAAQHSFCHYIVADPQMDAASAYLKVNPEIGNKSAANGSYRYMKMPEIRTYIGVLLERREKRMEMDEDWVIRSLREIYDRCMESEPVYGKNGVLNDDGEIAEPIYYKFDANGATKSLELIGKHMKMFSDKVDVANMNVTVMMQLGGNKPVIEGEFKRVGRN